MHIYYGCCWILLSQTAILPLAGWKSTLSTFYTFISQSNWSNLMSCTTESLAIDIHTHHHHHTDDMVFRFACDDSLLLVEFQSIWHIYGEYIFTDLSIHFSTVFARDWAKLYLILSFFLRFPCSPVPFVFRNQMASHTANRTQRKRKRERESEILTRMTEWNTKKGMQFIFFIFHFGSATKESKSYTHTQCVRELPTTFVNFAILTSNT